jgi:hypothetical protein
MDPLPVITVDDFVDRVALFLASDNRCVPRVEVQQPISISDWSRVGLRAMRKSKRVPIQDFM